MKRLVGLLAIVVITGCSTPGEENRSDSFGVNKANSSQDIETIEIVNVLPAKIEVRNTQNKSVAKVAGSVAGAIAGALLGRSVSGSDDRGTGAAVGAVLGGIGGHAAGGTVSDKTLVAGVSIIYKRYDQTITSTQVGEVCEFKAGPAYLIYSNDDETRIQPNSECE